MQRAMLTTTAMALVLGVGAASFADNGSTKPPANPKSRAMTTASTTPPAHNTTNTHNKNANNATTTNANNNTTAATPAWATRYQSGRIVFRALTTLSANGTLSAEQAANVQAASNRFNEASRTFLTSNANALQGNGQRNAATTNAAMNNIPTGLDSLTGIWSTFTKEQFTAFAREVRGLNAAANAQANAAGKFSRPGRTKNDTNAATSNASTWQHAGLTKGGFTSASASATIDPDNLPAALRQQLDKLTPEQRELALQKLRERRSTAVDTSTGSND